MAIDGRVRASRQDRETTVEALRQAYVAGRLDLPELRQRSGAAYCARTWGDLALLVADLPEHAFAWDVQAFRPPAPPSPPPADHRAVTGRRPFAPLSVMAAAWLVIAVLSRADMAAIPLVLLALWALYTSGHRSPRLGGQPEAGDGLPSGPGGPAAGPVAGPAAGAVAGRGPVKRAAPRCTAARPAWRPGTRCGRRGNQARQARAPHAERAESPGGAQ